MASCKARDTYRLFTSISVFIVAAIAASVSYVHISDLALKYGQSAMAAYLLPLSVDGLVTVASLAMFRSARAGLTSPAMARTGLFLGIIATLGANVASGLSHGPVGAVIAGWPAVAFVISAEIAIGMVRRKPARVVTASPSADPVTSAELVKTSKVSRLARTADQDQVVMNAMLGNPGVTIADLAAELGTSERTARRVRDRVTPLVSPDGRYVARAVTG